MILTVAGLLFGWDRALYSIIFQFTSTQVIQMLHQRYKKHTLFIITKEPYQIYEEIFKLTNHTATRFEGTGCYTDEKTSMIYSVVSTEEAKYLVKKVHEIDPKAFVNIRYKEFCSFTGLLIGRTVTGTQGGRCIWVMQQKAHFLTAMPQAMTAKPAGHVPVPPVMSRSFATDAAPVRTSHGN